ncbi:hypothetical protein EVAR_101807_1 [Eumeta japonica]|uniref:Gustatory receptor n=1 Tax=Eumeta variegata TaxID=151549 RepID=A0A4C1SNF4_EUMVA|nr:hypothetical protein EVAR_101807_1 [Eumeta japonica]
MAGWPHAHKASVSLLPKFRANFFPFHRPTSRFAPLPSPLHQLTPPPSLVLFPPKRPMDEWKVLLPVFLETLQVAFLPCLPGVVSECVACEVDKIKSTLLRHVANLPRSQEEYEEIQLFLRYLKTRGFHYRVWRTIRVDGRLLLGFIGLCTTYLIVLMQFTQFY